MKAREAIPAGGRGMNEARSATTPGGLAAAVNRYAPVIKWASVALIALGVLLTVRHLPVGPAVEALEGWAQGFGPWGAVVFGLAYVVAVVALVPASALTLAAGAVFGLVVGTVTVSLASTTGAGLALLIARHLARDRVAGVARRYPRFGAIDRAVSEGGWKVVALLRLSPAVPFNLQNYFYGLTGIGFWPCVLTSWLAMLPGTFLYVYLGHLGREGLEAAAGGTERPRGPAEWALLIVGLLATVAVTVYVTRLARKALRQHTGLQCRPLAPRAAARSRSERSTFGAGEPGPDSQAGQTRPEGWPWGATVTAILAVVALVVAGYAQLHPDLFTRLFGGLLGPPPVTLHEAYEEKPGGPTFDHSALDALLKAHVDQAGGVDYRGLKRDAVKLDSYLQALANAPFDDMGRSQKLALLINAYNAFTLRLILDYYPIDSIQSIPAEKRFDDVRWRVGRHTWSLNQIEHEQIRPKFREPRVHFALVCAAVGCPKLRNEGYRADRLDRQLEDQARSTHRHGRWFRFDAEAKVVRLTKLYHWYGGDFKQVAGSVLDYAARYAPRLKEALDAGKRPRVEWLDYDWALNSADKARD